MTTSTMEASTTSGLGAAMRFFGKKSGQAVSDFKAEWETLTATHQAELVAGIRDGSLTY